MTLDADNGKTSSAPVSAPAPAHLGKTVVASLIFGVACSYGFYRAMLERVDNEDRAVCRKMSTGFGDQVLRNEDQAKPLNSLAEIQKRCGDLIGPVEVDACGIAETVVKVVKSAKQDVRLALYLEALHVQKRCK